MHGVIPLSDIALYLRHRTSVAPARSVSLPGTGKKRDKRKARNGLTAQDKTIIPRVIAILEAGQSSKFQFEGACRHGLRSGFCLDGMAWAKADARALAIVTEALRRIGAERPTWNEAQPSYVEEGSAAIGRLHCERCSRRITGEPVARFFCSSLCSSAHRKAKHRKSGEAMSRAEYLASVAARRKALVRPCEHCGKRFEPRNAAATLQRYCSAPCAHAAIRLRPDQSACTQCGNLFVPDSVGRKYCSHSCYAASKASRAYEPRPCTVCGESFSPGQPGAIYCSTACQARADRAKKAATLPPLACENCGAEFRSSRPEARFCGTSCSAIARNRAKREAAGGFLCEAAE